MSPPSGTFTMHWEEALVALVPACCSAFHVPETRITSTGCVTWCIIVVAELWVGKPLPTTCANQTNKIDLQHSLVNIIYNHSLQ